ncbi:MAG: hypothetical protein GAK45_00126 [Pseudomonas citronellolis]|nr:MAG: hypothetical protein GAK45_00126 [Pseudomonas citronellolis]
MSEKLENVVDLDTPISRGESPITQLTLNKPQAGALRGLHLVDLLQMDVASIMKLLPRITSPTITDAEANNMDPADLMACGAIISGFLLQKQAKAAVSLLA